MKWLLRGLAVTCSITGFCLVLNNWTITGLVLVSIAAVVLGAVVVIGESELNDIERRMDERH